MKTARLSHSARLSKTRKSQTTVLEREEWFFGKVAEDEILTCFYYEYARSRKDIRELVHFWRENLADLDKAYDAANTREARFARGGVDDTFVSLEKATGRFWRELAQLTDSTCSQLLINLHEFPETPWQRIHPARRKQWKNLLRFYDYLDRIRGGLWRETNQNAAYAIRYNNMRTSRGELVPFLINWNGGVEKVINDFEKWARKHYSTVKLIGWSFSGEATDITKKKEPRKTYHEALKQLGVMRLKEMLGDWDTVQKHTQTAIGCKLYGDDHAVWRKARLAAIKRLRQMFPIVRMY